MKKLSFAPLVLLFATLAGQPAFAVKVQLRANALVGQFQKAGGEQVFVSLRFQASGKVLLKVRHSGDANPTWVLEEPAVIKDSRPMDGPLYLKVGTTQLMWARVTQWTGPSLTNFRSSTTCWT